MRGGGGGGGSNFLRGIKVSILSNFNTKFSMYSD